eukprot:6504603-Ditylum_brightwellii.AAC.1
MENTTNPPLFQVGQHVMVFHDTTWYPTRILAIDIIFCFPTNEIYEYLICWEWLGWEDIVVLEEDIMMIAGRRQCRQTNFYSPGATGN